jgi:hypothetical protein
LAENADDYWTFVIYKSLLPCSLTVLRKIRSRVALHRVYDFLAERWPA